MGSSNAVRAANVGRRAFNPDSQRIFRDGRRPAAAVGLLFRKSRRPTRHAGTCAPRDQGPPPNRRRNSPRDTCRPECPFSYSHASHAAVALTGEASAVPKTREDSTHPGALFRTFLISDIRGYSTFTRERGDEIAARLAIEVRRSRPRRGRGSGREGHRAQRRRSACGVRFDAASCPCRARVPGGVPGGDQRGSRAPATGRGSGSTAARRSP